MKKFNELISNDDILKSLEVMGIETPTEIQAESIPTAVEGHDVLAESKTGSGKTISFGIPAINLVDKNTKSVQAVVITPTRELANQVSKELQKLSKYSRHIKIASVFGGQSMDKQIQALRSGTNIVVGTPGRIKDHLKRKTLKIDSLKMLVLDEADVMLDMGFAPEINDILKFVDSDDLQTMLFSATIPKQIVNISKTYLKKDYKHVKIHSTEKTADTIDQYAMIVNRSEKLESLYKVVENDDAKKIIIFSNTKSMCDELGVKLGIKGFKASALHGDLKQSQRDKVMKKFRENKEHILIATDVAARGIDVSNVELVINYDLPKELDFYVHRIGRSGRANTSGKSISLLVNSEKRHLSNIERHINKKITMMDSVIKPMKFEDVSEELKQIALKSEVESKKMQKLEFLKSSFENEEDYEKALVYIFEYYLDKKVTKPVKRDNSSNGRDRDSDRGQGQRSLTNKNDTRIHLNLGKMDKVKPSRLVELITSNARISQRDINNVKVLDRFSFFDVPKNNEQDVIKAFTNFKFGNRKLNAMVAKNIKR